MPRFSRKRQLIRIAARFALNIPSRPMPKDMISAATAPPRIVVGEMLRRHDRHFIWLVSFIVTVGMLVVTAVKLL